MIVMLIVKYILDTSKCHLDVISYIPVKMRKNLKIYHYIYKTLK